jgi:hypothetical protein
MAHVVHSYLSVVSPVALFLNASAALVDWYTSQTLHTNCISSFWIISDFSYSLFPLILMTHLLTNTMKSGYDFINLIVIIRFNARKAKPMGWGYVVVLALSAQEMLFYN